MASENPVPLRQGGDDAPWAAAVAVGVVRSAQVQTILWRWSQEDLLMALGCHVGELRMDDCKV